MSRKKVTILILIVVMASLSSNSFTFGYGFPSRGYNLAFDNEEEIFLPDKNETVFSLLGHDGTALETRVLNRLTGVPDENHSWIVDYGPYRKVKNLVSGEEPYSLGDRVFWPAEMLKDGDIYYEGYTDQSLPLGISIEYSLDGQKLKAAEVLGKDGKLEIHLTFENQLFDDEPLKYIDSKGRTISRKERNYVPLMVQGTIPVDLEKFSEIAISQGTVLEVGRTANVSFMVFPYPDGQVTVQMLGKEIELNPISLTVIPQMVPISELDGADELKKILEGLSSVEEGLQNIRQGVKEITAGTDQADQGIQDVFSSVLAGLENMEEAFVELGVGLEEITSGMKQFDQGLHELFSGLKMGTDEISTALMELYEASDQMLSALEQMRDEMNRIILPMIPALQQIDEVLANLEEFESDIAFQVLQSILEMMDELLDWLRNQPEEELDGALARHQGEINVLSERAKIYESELTDLVRMNEDLVEIAERLMEENPVGSDLHNLGVALLDQSRKISTLEKQWSGLNHAVSEVENSEKALHLIYSQLMDEFIEKLQELLEEMAKRDGFDPDNYQTLFDYLRNAVEYTNELRTILPSIREQIGKLIELPENLDKLVEGQRMIRDGIKMVHDVGILELKYGILSAERQFSLKVLLDGLTKMSFGMQSIANEGLGPLKLGLGGAKAKLSLVPLIEAQVEVQEGIGKIIDEGLVPMQAGLHAGVSDLLYAEEKISRMERLAESYQSFADNHRNTNSTVRFVMRTMPLGREKEVHDEQGDQPHGESLLTILWERLIRLFGKMD